MSISSEVEQNIGRILHDVRRSSSASETSQSSFASSRSHSETRQTGHSSFGSARSYSETGHSSFGNYSETGQSSSKSYSKTGQSGFGSSRSYSETGQTSQSTSRSYTETGQDYTRNYSDTGLTRQTSTCSSSTSLPSHRESPRTSSALDLVDGQRNTSMCVGGDVEGASCDSVESGGGAGLWMDCSESYTPSPLDEQLKDDLLQRQKTNSKYKRMLVSFMCTKCVLSFS